MSDPAQNTQRPSSRFGRTAWMVFGAGWLAATGMITVGTIAEPYAAKRGVEHLIPVFAVALAIGGVGTVWALVLALRALWRGEKPGLPVWLIHVTTLLPAAYGLVHWFPLPEHVLLQKEWMDELYLPVLLPFWSLAWISGWTVIPRVMRRWERRRVAKGRPEYTPRQFFRACLLWLWAYTILLGTILLPLPLYLHCYLHWPFTLGRKWVAENTPLPIRNAAERILSLDLNIRWGHAQQRLLRQGRVSRERLMLRYGDANGAVSLAALIGASKSEPQWAADRAAEILANPALAPTSSLRVDAQNLLAKFGTTLQRRTYLEYLVRNGSPLIRGFLFSLRDAPRDEALLPDLEKLLQSQAPDREYALLPLISWLPLEKTEPLLERLCDEDNAYLELVAKDTGAAFAALKTKLFFHFIEHRDVAVRRKVLDCFYLPEKLGAEKPKLVQALLKKLDSEDLPERRGAARTLAIILNGGGPVLVHTEWLQLVYTPENLAAPVETGGKPLAESPAETKAVKDAREVAETWLRENGQ